MASSHLRRARQEAGLSQLEVATRLGVSQPYYSQVEAGSRPLPSSLAARAVRELSASPCVLPLPEVTWHWVAVPPEQLVDALASLGYPPFAHLKKNTAEMNPAWVVAGVLAHSDLDVRIVEGLPWVLARFDDIDAGWLLAQCRMLNLQNRLGYLVTLALRIEADGAKLEELLVELEKSRLASEDTLCRGSMPEAERAWVRGHRPLEAEHWGLLTTLTKDQLAYAA